ncbi:MAG: stage III sporulation protein AA [Syntrophomonadaceae bacterium]|nr:stage III sporulation protein AA [Syntrophomonadaceae bacterium]
MRNKLCRSFLRCLKIRKALRWCSKLLANKETIRKEIGSYLPAGIKEKLLKLPDECYTKLEEIRIRAAKPLQLRIGEEDYGLSLRAELVKDLCESYIVTADDVFRILASISDNSLYAFEEEIRRGFITIPGGHRVGLAGQVILQGNEVKTIKDFSGICFRVAREVKDCARTIIPQICVGSKGTPVNTLIISPPRCGKTTILRDLARLLSTGSKQGGAQNVVIIDERSEIAGCYRGVPQLEVGPRTDVLDACPKALGMMMAIRSLSPQVLITDEIGSREDLQAINDCVNAGVALISSIHAKNLDDIKKRPQLNQLLNTGVFKTLVVLSRRSGPGRVEEIISLG